MQVKGTRMYRVKAVAEMFDVSVATIYRAIESGELAALKIGSGKQGAVRIPEPAVDAFQKVCAANAARDAANRRAVEEHTEPEVTAEEWLAGTPTFGWPGGGVCPLETCWSPVDVDDVVSGEVG